MNQHRRHTNIVSCLVKRQQGTLFCDERRALYGFGEDQTAFRSKRIVKCQLSGSPRSTFLVAFSPDGKIMASTHGDHTVRVIDVKTGRCLDTLRGHPRTPWTISFHPSKPNFLASGCLGGEVRVWDLTRGDSTLCQLPQSTPISSLAFHPIDLVLLIATDNRLLFWNWEQSTPFACINTSSQQQKLRLVKFDPLGQHILTGIRNPPTTFHTPDTRSDRNAHGSGGNENLSDESGESSGLPTSSSRVERNVHGNNANVDVSVQTSQMPTPQRVSQQEDTRSENSDHSSALHHYRTTGAIIEVTGSAVRVAEVFNMFVTASLQASINYAIADALVERGGVAMASNITATTCRLQLWDFTNLDMPQLQESNSNVVVDRCKLYNDASTDISADGRLLAAFVPNLNDFTEFGHISVFSLESFNLGQCLFSRQFGPNAISVSFSPLSQYLLVGLANRRYPYIGILSASQVVAKVFKFSCVAKTMELISSLMYQCPDGGPSYNISTNAAFWNPVPGSGLVYGTNKGGLYLCYPDMQSDPISG